MIEQPCRQLPYIQRLHPFLAHVQLDDCNCPQQRPRHPRRKLRLLVLLLGRDEDHLGRGIAAPSGPPQPLHEARAAVRRAELQHALQLAKVNAQLQRQRRCGNSRAGALAERGLRLLAQHRRDAAVVHMEHVALPALRGHPPHLEDGLLRIRAAVREDQRLLQMRMVVDEPVIALPRLLQPLGLYLVPRIREREMLHAQPELASALRRGHLYALARSGGQPLRHGGIVAERSGEPDPPRMAAGHPRDPRQLAEHLDAAVRAHKRMHFINDDEAQIMEQGRNGIRPVHQQAFQRLRSNLEDAGGLLHQPGFVRLRHVAVPVPDRDVALAQQII
ncbi:hypothetical protein D3C75_227980 [compost metagenome]